MGKKKIIKKENKSIEKVEKSLFKSFLGHMTGIVASLGLFLSIYIYIIYIGVLSTPQFINSYPERFNVRNNISSEVLDNANIKYEAWKISNKSNLETTMSISEEEFFSMVKLVEKPLEVLNIKNNEIIFGEKKKFGKSNWKFSMITKFSYKKGILKLVPISCYIGRIKLPNIIFSFTKSVTFFDKPLINHISSTLNKFKYQNKKIKIVTEDGEIKLSNRES